MNLKQLLRKKNLSKKDKLLLNQFQHSLKSPTRFQLYLDRIASWLSRKTDLHEINDAFKVFHSSYSVAPEAARISLTQLLHTLFMLFMQNPAFFLGFAEKMVQNAEVRNHYPHTMPEHGSQIVAEGKWQQAPKKTVYNRARSHYDSNYLQANADSVTSVLNNTLKNNDPVLTPDLKQALHVIMESVAKVRGTSLSKTSRKHNIPLKTLSDYVAKDIIPVLYRDKNTIYLANETTEEVSRDYREAKALGIQPARLLRERRDKYFQLASLI